jgi:O-antigen/teichoic acid export membrane protein
MATRPPVEASPKRHTPSLLFALIGHPTVQLLRFGAKFALAWFLAPEDYGEVMLAGTLTVVAGHLALLGLDEAWIHARRAGPVLLRQLGRVHLTSGAVAAALLALAGWLLIDSEQNALLGRLMLALAPMVCLANLSVMPTAVLVRAQQYRLLFSLDVAGAAAWAGVTLLSAALDGGPWSLVHGWYANAVVTVFAARRLAQRVPPPPCDDEDDLGRTLRFGRHMAAADLTDLAGERAGGLAVGFGIGRAALGLYEQALHLSSLMVTYARHLSERSLMPILADSHRQDELPGAHAEALRLSLVYLVPLHILLACVARPLLLLLPPAWHGTGPLAEVLALAAAAHCVGIVSYTALKAGDWSKPVARLGLFRLLLLGIALTVTLPLGSARAVAWGLTAAQSVAALSCVALATLRLGPDSRGRHIVAAMARSLALLAVWVPLQWLLLHFGTLDVFDNSIAAVAATLVVGGGSWLLLQSLIDRASLARDWRELRNGLQGDQT